MTKNNIFNISGNYSFVKSLKSWIQDRYLNFENLLIILPNNRSCNQLKNCFLEESFQGYIPNIKSIGDIDVVDFKMFLNEKDFLNIVNEFSAIKKIDLLEYIFFISQQLKESQIFGHISFENLCKIAIEFQKLFDDIEFEKINLNTFNNIDQHNLSIHRQISVDFVKNFYIHIKNLLIEKNLYFESAYQNLIFNKLCFYLDQGNLTKNVVVAGSTGSVLFVRNFIKSIANQINGKIIFYNFIEQKNLNNNHSQFLNNQLVNHLRIKPCEIRNIEINQYLIANNYRNLIINEFCKSSEEINSWQDIKNYSLIENLKNELIDNFLIVESDNKIDEAQSIAKIIKDNYNDKKIGVISNDYNLLSMIENELDNLDIIFSSSALTNLNHHPVIDFAIKILQIKESNFNSIKLLALFKHSLFKFCEQSLIVEFEIKILREQRTSNDLDDLILSSKKDVKLNNFIKEFIEALPKNKDIKSLIKSIEIISNNTWLNILNNDNNGKDIYCLFNKLINLNYNYADSSELKFLSSLYLFDPNHNQIFTNQPKVNILSTIEARLLNFDLVIICGMNNGVFPKKNEINWLGKKIYQDLGIYQNEKKYGQNCFDFCNYLLNPKIVITRSKKDSDFVNIASPFFLKFAILIKKILINCNQLYYKKNIINSKKLINLNAPCYHVSHDYLPKKYSISNLVLLAKDPYSFYIAKILNLNPINEIDYEASYKEFGSFFHEVLEHSTNHILDYEQIKEIFSKHFISKNSKYVWLPKFFKLYQKFQKNNIDFVNLKSINEYKIHYQNKYFLMTGKIDRIIIDKDQIIIIDYKTGVLPSKKNVLNGNDIQLGLYCYLLLNDKKFSEIKISHVGYWKLNEKITYVAQSENEIQLITKNAIEKIENFIELYYHNNYPFIANKESDNGLYKNIVRYQEWSL